MNRSVAALTAFALLTVPGVTSCGPAQTGHPARATSSQPPAPKSPAHLGQTLDLERIGAQKIAVTLDRVIEPATVPNGWGDPGYSYVATQLTIKNTGTTTIVGNSNSDVSVLGSDDQPYRADFATVTECRDFIYGWFLIAAGDATKGCVVFKLPAGVTPVKVKYTPSSGISHDVGEWLTT